MIKFKKILQKAGGKKSGAVGLMTARQKPRSVPGRGGSEPPEKADEPIPVEQPRDTNDTLADVTEAAFEGAQGKSAVTTEAAPSDTDETATSEVLTAAGEEGVDEPSASAADDELPEVAAAAGLAEEVAEEPARTSPDEVLKEIEAAMTQAETLAEEESGAAVESSDATEASDEEVFEAAAETVQEPAQSTHDSVPSEAVEAPGQMPQNADDEVQEEGLDRSFMAEVDQLLNQFGEAVVEETREYATANGLAGEEHGETQAETEVEQSEALDAPVEEATVVQDAVDEVSERADAAEEALKNALESVAAAKDEEVATAESVLAEIEEAALSTNELLQIPETQQTTAPVDDEAGVETPGDDEQGEFIEPEVEAGAFGETLSEEERAALMDDDMGTPFQDGSEDTDEETLTDAFDGEEESSEIAAQGATGEIELDFARELSDDAGKAEATETVNTDDLLSTVLGDLDKLGAVEKPKSQAAEPDADDEESDDFTQLLGNLDGGAPGGIIEGPPPLEKKAEEPEIPPSEEELIEEAMKGAGHKELETSSKDELINELLKPTGDSESESDDGEDSGMPGGGEMFEPEGEEETEDDDLLANLSTPPPVFEEDGGEIGTYKETSKVSSAEKDASAADAQSEEDIIRKEVLSRSKDVEQKVLDDIFGGDTDEFRDEIRTEMARIEEDQNAPPAGGSALSREAARLAGEGTFTGKAASMKDMLSSVARLGQTIRFGVMWLAFQTNKPFARWLNPARRQLLGIVSLFALGTSFLGLVLALVLRWAG